jgi:hypothetical protein
MDQYWKLPFNPGGYPPISLTLDTSQNKIGDVVSFSNDFFTSKGFVVNNGSTVLSSGILGTDIIFVNQNIYLSETAGNQIYRNIQIGTQAAIGLLSIQCSFIVDIVDPMDFMQSLTPTSDVTHNSLVLTSSLTAQSASITNIQSSMIQLGTSYLDSSMLSLSGTTLQDYNLYFSGSNFTISNDANYITYDPASDSFRKKNTGTKEEVSLVSFYTSSYPSGSIPFLNSANTSYLFCSPDFYYTANTNTLYVQALSTYSVNTNSLVLGAHSFTDIGGILIIDGYIQFNPAAQTLIIGSLVLNPENQTKLQNLLSQ